MPYRICLISLGCAKNQVNSEQMLYLLNQAGHDAVSYTHLDVYKRQIVNSVIY